MFLNGDLLKLSMFEELKLNNKIWVFLLVTASFSFFLTKETTTSCLFRPLLQHQWRFLEYCFLVSLNVCLLLTLSGLTENYTMCRRQNGLYRLLSSTSEKNEHVSAWWILLLNDRLDKFPTDAGTWLISPLRIYRCLFFFLLPRPIRCRSQ